MVKKNKKCINKNYIIEIFRTSSYIGKKPTKANKGKQKFNQINERKKKEKIKFRDKFQKQNEKS